MSAFLHKKEKSFVGGPNALFYMYHWISNDTKLNFMGSIILGLADQREYCTIY